MLQSFHSLMTSLANVVKTLANRTAAIVMQMAIPAPLLPATVKLRASGFAVVSS
jgi:hypothetical protein